MQVHGRRIKFSREDVLTALRMEMGYRGMGEFWPEGEEARNLVLSMNSRGGIEVRPRQQRDAVLPDHEAEAVPELLPQIRAQFLQWRGIDPRNLCPDCEGSGRKVYGSTALWRPGIGGAAMTPGVCDACWGSGDLNHPGVDLRRRERLEEERDALLASCGWLADVVIRDQGGTPDPNGWINRGKTFYREALDRASNFEAMLRRAVVRMRKSPEPGLVALAATAADLLERKGVSSPLREGGDDVPGDG